MSRSVYIGRSGTGKTTLLLTKIKQWMKEVPKKKSLLIVVSPTAPLQEGYQKIKNRIGKYFNEIDENVTTELYNICQENAKKEEKQQKEIIIIIDDLGESNFMKHVSKHNQLNTLIVTARHMKVHLCFLFQRMKQATNSLRDNADIIYLFKVEDIDQRKQFKNSFCSSLSEEEFKKVTDEAWKAPYGYLKIDRRDPQSEKFYLNEKEIDPTGHQFYFFIFFYPNVRFKMVKKMDI
jgi:Cdc6-like AAA superfamily ATPase